MSLLGKMLGFGRNAQYDRGLRLFDQGQYEEAIEAFAQAKAAGQKDPLTERLTSFYTAESCAHLGHAAMSRGLWSRAQDYFGRALQIHPHYADLHFHLALAYRATKQDEVALVYLNKALNINANYAKAHLYRSLICYERGARPEALVALMRALELEPGYCTEAFTRGMAYHEAGDFLAALQAFEQITHTDIDDILFHFKLADDLYRRGLYDDAVGEYRKALSLNPNYADIRNHLGISLSALGLESQAITEFEQALVINPKFVDAMLNLAMTLRDSGRGDEAHAWFTRSLEIEPENPIATENLRASASARQAA